MIIKEIGMGRFTPSKHQTTSEPSQAQQLAPPDLRRASENPIDAKYFSHVSNLRDKRNEMDRETFFPQHNEGLSLLDFLLAGPPRENGCYSFREGPFRH